MSESKFVVWMYRLFTYNAIAPGETSYLKGIGS